MSGIMLYADFIYLHARLVLCLLVNLSLFLQWKNKPPQPPHWLTPWNQRVLLTMYPTSYSWRKEIQGPTTIPKRWTFLASLIIGRILEVNFNIFSSSFRFWASKTIPTERTCWWAPMSLPIIVALQVFLPMYSVSHILLVWMVDSWDWIKFEALRLHRKINSDLRRIPARQWWALITVFLAGILYFSFEIISISFQNWESNIQEGPIPATWWAAMLLPIIVLLALQVSFFTKRAQPDKPDNWKGTDNILVDVPAESSEYWDVVERMRETMSNCHVSKLWRVQNISLWSYYNLHKERLASHGALPNERTVFHGTSKTDPAKIYNDRQDGFMMQFAQRGLWGRGIYFADHSSYSNRYSFKPSEFYCLEDRPDTENDDEREMFLARLLVGNHIEMTQYDTSLLVPPYMPGSDLKYNTVCGSTGRSKVYVVYENGRAYPEYLIRYYFGKRDPRRTPYQTRLDAVFFIDYFWSMIYKWLFEE